jgi:hypothetical protein
VEFDQLQLSRIKNGIRELFFQDSNVMKGAVYTVAQARSVAITMAIVANEMSERDADE